MNLNHKNIAVAAVCLSIALSFGCKKEETAQAPAQPQTQAPAPAPAQPQASTPAPASAAEFSATLPPALAGKQMTPGGKANVDAINKSGDKVVSVKSTEKFDINGWAYEDKGKTVPESIFIELAAKGGEKFYVAASRSPRPDLAKTFHEEAYSKAGYNKKADLKAVPAGEYQINLVQVVDGNAIVTPSGKKVKID